MSLAYLNVTTMKFIQQKTLDYKLVFLLIKHKKRSLKKKRKTKNPCGPEEDTWCKGGFHIPNKRLMNYDKT